MHINRDAYKILLNDIEDSYPVNEWMHKGYHIWPILRLRLFIMMVRQYEGSRHTQSVQSKVQKLYKKIITIPISWLNYYNLSESFNELYCGASAYRVDYLGKSYNKYFDYLMDKKIDQNNLLLEYSSFSKENIYKPERVLLVSNLIKCFKLYEKAKDIIGRENHYAKELDKILQQKDFLVKNFVADTSRQITNVDRAAVFFEKLLKRISPTKIYELCYYSTDMLGLNIAADRLGIPTVDMQHGPYHLAYWSWENVPSQGYEALPNEFHTWDQSSADSVKEWCKGTTKHSATVTGNPWVEGWKKGVFKASDYVWPDNLMLYTLQPTGEPLEPYLLQTINETCDRWNWWLRLHPRQSAELPAIKRKLKKEGLLEKVNIKDATELPLPEILIHTKVHITKFSGCAIEAFNFQTPTILLDKRGEQMFEDYLSYEIMTSCTKKESGKLVEKIIHLMNMGGVE